MAPLMLALLRRTTTSTASDMALCAKGEAQLAAHLQHAPGCFTALNLLREAPVILDKKYQIMDPELAKHRKQRFDWAWGLRR